MATKDQVLKLLEKGLNPQQIAKKLGCKDAYVRATRQRAKHPGYDTQFPSYSKARDRYHTDPEYREEAKRYGREHNRKRYQNDPEYRERKRLYSLRYYHARKAEQSQSAN